MKKVKAVLFSLILSFVISGILVGIAALVISKIQILPEKAMPLVVTVLCAVSVLLGGYNAARVLKERGILFGFLTALIYALILLGISMCIEPGFGIGTFGKLSAILLSGSIGGIIAVNRRSKVTF